MARLDLEGHHVVVTGASSGIGAAIAVELGRRGAHVGLVARRPEQLDEVARAIEAAGGRAAREPADVCDFEALSQAVGRLEERLGPVYGLVANAGVGDPTTGGILRPERERRLFDVNVMGVVNSLAAVQPGLLERGEGFLAAVSSLAAWRGLPDSAAYSASKAAVTALMESLRLDLARRGVSVTTIHPGFVKTPMTDKNRFPMPFLMPVEAAARVVVDGLERRRAQIDFPWQLAFIMRAVRRMPLWLYDRALRRAKSDGARGRA